MAVCKRDPGTPFSGPRRQRAPPDASSVLLFFYLFLLLDPLSLRFTFRRRNIATIRYNVRRRRGEARDRHPVRTPPRGRSFRFRPASALHQPWVLPISVAGCSAHYECPSDQACVANQCQNPCQHNNPCSPQQDCQVQDHLPVCLKRECSNPA